ncbi:three-Cys-motif partner protein TcmP [Prosthecobacter sp.]|jgi:three-Cys-motif partner protein|uniref:three-Cys-motif partner protein TcmP n=1 Tax=Prosthecobacter sp. TaxID=1965333 RepID=UPI0037C85B89
MNAPKSGFGKFGGKWTDLKLAVVNEYFTQFNTALSNTKFTRVYIDAFAGGGRVIPKTEKTASPKIASKEDLFSGHSNNGCSQPVDENEEDEAENFRHGSPLLALETNPPFNEFIFIERDELTLNQLKQQISDNRMSRGRPVEYLAEDANTALCRISNDDWRERRAVIFLDPFALEIRWSTLEAIAQTKAMDMWLLFPAMAVNRMLPRSTEVPEDWAKRLDETFGDSSWKAEFYAKPGPPAIDDFFPDSLPEAKEAKLDDPFGRLNRYVVRRLKTVFAGVVEEALVLKTSSGTPLFLLCFAVANENGAPIAKRIASHIIKKQKNGI